MTAPVIALHAERVAGDPHAVRWVVPAGSLPIGRVWRAPGRLGVLFHNGTLTVGLVEGTAVWLWLREDLAWTGHGTAVQAALREALTKPDEWSIEAAPGEVLHLVTIDLLDGTVGDFIRSHGGSVNARRVGDDEVVVQLGGACEHCPAAGHTLRLRLMDELRRRCPGLTEVDRAGTQLTLSLASVVA